MNTLEMTQTELAEKLNFSSLDHLPSAEIPVIFQEPTRQGDVFFDYVENPGKVAGLKAIPTSGVVLVKGENNGNTHVLLPDNGMFGKGEALFAANPTAGQQWLGTLELSDGAVALVAHPEHGYQAILGPGQYIVKRQRQQLDEIQLVAD